MVRADPAKTFPFVANGQRFFGQKLHDGDRDEPDNDDSNVYTISCRDRSRSCRVEGKPGAVCQFC